MHWNINYWDAEMLDAQREAGDTNYT